jgi:hypothetical protein
MEAPEFNKKATEMLEAFAYLDPIEPSEDWQQSLLLKLADTKPAPEASFSPMSYTAVMFFFILLNCVFVFSLMKKETPQYNNRVARLETISQELLMNSSSNN